jgi:fumarate reductase subunit C
MNQFIESLRNPFLLFYHVVVLAFALLHSITWFNLTPKVMVIRRGEERVPDVLVAGSNYIACLGVSLLLWWIVKG